MPATPKKRKLQNPLEANLGYQLRRAATHMQADLSHRIGELGLTMVEMSTLLVIEANPGVTQSEIGRMIAIKRANMAPLTAGLAARNLVVATPVDKRSNGLSLTSDGLAIVTQLHQCVAQNEAVLFTQIPEDQRGAVIASVRKIWALEN
jgi:DNA-binding MarR family transcriptional regulator